MALAFFSSSTAFSAPAKVVSRTTPAAASLRMSVADMCAAAGPQPPPLAQSTA